MLFYQECGRLKGCLFAKKWIAQKKIEVDPKLLEEEERLRNIEQDLIEFLNI